MDDPIIQRTNAQIEQIEAELREYARQHDETIVSLMAALNAPTNDELVVVMYSLIQDNATAVLVGRAAFLGLARAVRSLIEEE